MTNVSCVLEMDLAVDVSRSRSKQLLYNRERHFGSKLLPYYYYYHHHHLIVVLRWRFKVSAALRVLTGCRKGRRQIGRPRSSRG